MNDLLELIGISSCWLFLQFLAMPLIKNGWNGHFSKAKWWMGSQTLVLSSSILGRDWTAVSSSSIYIIELEICCRRSPRLCTPRFAVFFKTNPMSQWSRIVFPMFDGRLGLYRVSPGSVFLGTTPIRTVQPPIHLDELCEGCATDCRGLGCFLRGAVSLVIQLQLLWRMIHRTNKIRRASREV